MPDFSRWGANGGDPSLNAIGRTDRYLDALASEYPVYATDPADAELANLMAGWRDEVRRPPARVAAQRDAEIVLHRALASRRRTRMSMAVVGSVAAALLCLGGFGAVVYSAGPGDALYGLRVSLFGEQQRTRDDKVALAAQTEMQQVQQLIDQGNWTEAQNKLQTVTSTVQTVEDPQRQQQLQQQLAQLSVKVESRDPNATLPAAPVEPQAPGAPVQLPSINLPETLPSLPLPASLPSLPSLPLPGPGATLPLPGPGATLPLPAPGSPLPLPGSIVPPEVSIPGLPPISLPKPLPDGPKQVPGDQKPDPIGQKPDRGDQKPAPKPDTQLPGPALDEPKPAQKPDSPRSVEQSKPLIPDIPIPKPAQVPAPDAPVIPFVPAPAPASKAPALAPAQQEPQQDVTTTYPPTPAEKPKRGNGN